MPPSSFVKHQYFQIFVRLQFDTMRSGGADSIQTKTTFSQNVSKISNNKETLTIMPKPQLSLCLHVFQISSFPSPPHTGNPFIIMLLYKVSDIIMLLGVSFCYSVCFVIKSVGATELKTHFDFLKV